MTCALLKVSMEGVTKERVISISMSMVGVYNEGVISISMSIEGANKEGKIPRWVTEAGPGLLIL